MRYRWANTIPGVNPPTGKESDETSRPTGVGAMTAAATGDSAVGVGACESEPISAPQLRQNLSVDDISPPQDGQSTVSFRSGFSSAQCDKTDAAIFNADGAKVKK
jgi:hypothetical protein